MALSYNNTRLQDRLRESIDRTITTREIPSLDLFCVQFEIGYLCLLMGMYDLDRRLLVLSYFEAR